MDNNQDSQNTASEKNQEEEKIYVIRSKHDKENPYVMISKALLRDQNLSIEGKGLLCYLLSLPDNWKVHPRKMASELGINKDTIYNLLNHLIDLGYCRRHQKKDGTRFSIIQYEFSESPIFKKCLPCPGFPDTEVPDPENPDTYRIKNIQNTDNKDILTPACADVKKSDPMPSAKKKREKPDIPKVPDKIQRRDFVKTSEEEHKKLHEKYGPAKTEKYYDALNDWKASKAEADPKAINNHSDYYRITKWVAKDTDAQEAEGNKNPVKSNNNLDVEDQEKNHHLFGIYLQSNYAKASAKGIYLADRGNRAKIGNDEIYYNNPRFTELVKHALRKVGL